MVEKRGWIEIIHKMRLTAANVIGRKMFTGVVIREREGELRRT